MALYWSGWGLPERAELWTSGAVVRDNDEEYDAYSAGPSIEAILLSGVGPASYQPTYLWSERQTWLMFTTIDAGHPIVGFSGEADQIQTLASAPSSRAVSRDDHQ